MRRRLARSCATTLVLALTVTLGGGCPGEPIDTDDTGTDTGDTADTADTDTDSGGDFTHDQIERYEGPSTCVACHTDAAHEVMGSTHYTFRQELPADYLYDPDGTEADNLYTGKGFKVCGFPSALAQSNWAGAIFDDGGATTEHVDVPGGCGTCHVGIGIQPYSVKGRTSPTAAETEFNVDCLI